MRLVVEIPGDQLDDRLEPWQVEELAQDALGRAFAPGKVKVRRAHHTEEAVMELVDEERAILRRAMAESECPGCGTYGGCTCDAEVEPPTPAE